MRININYIIQSNSSTTISYVILIKQIFRTILRNVNTRLNVHNCLTSRIAEKSSENTLAPGVHGIRRDKLECSNNLIQHSTGWFRKLCDIWRCWMLWLGFPAKMGKFFSTQLNHRCNAALSLKWWPIFISSQSVVVRDKLQLPLSIIHVYNIKFGPSS